MLSIKASAGCWAQRIPGLSEAYHLLAIQQLLRQNRGQPAEHMPAGINKGVLWHLDSVSTAKVQRFNGVTRSWAACLNFSAQGEPPRIPQ